MRLLLFLYAFLMATMLVSGEYDNERYIILLEEGSNDGDVEQLIQRMEVHASSTREEMHVGTLTQLLPFVYGNMSEATAEMVANLPNVELIEKDQVVHPLKTINDEDIPEVTSFETDRYNLDIIDDVNCTDGTFMPIIGYGEGSDIYIVDSGIKYNHADFRYRDGRSGTRVKYGYDAIDALYGTSTRGRDVGGHGTHCAGIAAGVDSGVAKDANLYSVRVLGSSPYYGSWATVIAGLNHVVKIHNIRSQGRDFKGSIASMSIGGYSAAAESAANKLWELGIVTVAASGNSAQDACLKTFGRTSNIICVGAHVYNVNTCVKKMLAFSNYGSCVDVMAPGYRILSTSIIGTTGFTRRSGTSMAGAHVAGVAALMKAVNSGLTPVQIERRLRGYGINDIDRTDRPANVQEVSHSKRLFVSRYLVK